MSDEQPATAEIDDDDAVLLEGGPLDEATQALVLNGDGFDALVTQVEAPPLVSEQDLDSLFGEDEDEEDLDDDELDLGDDDDGGEIDHRLDHAFEIEDTPAPAPAPAPAAPAGPAPPVSTAEAERVKKLEVAVQQLAGAEVTREGQRVRRKVTAATGGAGVIGMAPILLQLTGAISVSPEMASTLAAVAAALGALVAGWATPERQAALPPEAAVDILSIPR